MALVIAIRDHTINSWWHHDHRSPRQVIESSPTNKKMCSRCGPNLVRFLGTWKIAQPCAWNLWLLHLPMQLCRKQCKILVLSLFS